MPEPLEQFDELHPAGLRETLRVLRLQPHGQGSGGPGGSGATSGFSPRTTDPRREMEHIPFVSFVVVWWLWNLSWAGWAVTTDGSCWSIELVGACSLLVVVVLAAGL